MPTVPKRSSGDGLDISGLRCVWQLLEVQSFAIGRVQTFFSLGDGYFSTFSPGETPNQSPLWGSNVMLSISLVIVSHEFCFMPTLVNAITHVLLLRPSLLFEAFVYRYPALGNPQASVHSSQLSCLQVSSLGKPSCVCPQLSV